MTDATQQLRKLIDDYYSGQTSDNMIREIVRLFSDLPTVPPDLALDQQIFMAYDKLPDTLPPTPDRLNRLIDQTVESCQANQGRNRPVLLRWLVASVAAAALIALLLSIGDIVNSDKTLSGQPVESTQLISGEPEFKPKPENKPIPNVEMQKESNLTNKLIAQTDTRPVDRSSSHRTSSVASSTNHVITDPIEAAQRLDAVFDMLDNQLSFSAQTQTEALNALNIANEKVSDILTSSLQ